MHPATASNIDALNEECARHLQALIRLDTSNPPGNEIVAANYIRDQLQAVRITPEIVESEPGRANLRAVLKGDNSERPILLMSHLDVVPAEAELWTRPPFSGEEADGYIWGRGAVDMKQWSAWHLTILLELARTQTPLKRDVVLLATADEENGSYKGMRWIAEKMPQWLDAEYGLSEGGGGEMQVAGRSFFPCRVAEKGACRFRMTAHGSPGHASRPHSDNALVKLGTALERIGSMPMPVKETEYVRHMLEEMLHGVEGREGLVDDIFGDYASDLAIQTAPFSSSMKLALSAQIRNTAAPTILHRAGASINVIPSTAEADVDGRPMPGISAEEFIQEVRAIIGNTVDIDVYEYWPGSASKFDTELFGIMKEVTASVADGAVLVPYLATGASDARFAEPLGVNVYGFGPMRAESGASPTDLMHAHDERISLDNLAFGLRILYDTVLRIAAR